jgi:hypothetical protein
MVPQHQLQQRLIEAEVQSLRMGLRTAIPELLMLLVWYYQ